MWTTIGINELNKTSNIEVYPNPASDQLHILSESNAAIHHLSIQNLMGRQTYTTTVSGQTALDISHLLTGVYFITIQTGNEKITRKFIKQ